MTPHEYSIHPISQRRLQESLSQLEDRNLPLIYDLEKNDIPETKQNQGMWGLV